MEQMFKDEKQNLSVYVVSDKDRPLDLVNIAFALKNAHIAGADAFVAKIRDKRFGYDERRRAIYLLKEGEYQMLKTETTTETAKVVAEEKPVVAEPTAEETPKKKEDFSLSLEEEKESDEPKAVEVEPVTAPDDEISAKPVDMESFPAETEIGEKDPVEAEFEPHDELAVEETVFSIEETAEEKAEETETESDLYRGETQAHVDIEGLQAQLLVKDESIKAQAETILALRDENEKLKGELVKAQKIIDLIAKLNDDVVAILKG